MKRSKMSADVVAARKNLEGAIKQLLESSLNTVQGGLISGGRPPKTTP